MATRTDPSQMELVALDVLANSDTPIGSARLMEELRSQGITVSEATAGRYLRQLDQRGLTEGVNNTRGRMLTDRGRRRLRELTSAQRLEARSASFVNAAQATDVAQLMDLLVARRAVEVAAARQAAERATDSEAARLLAAARQHLSCVQGGEETTDVAMDCHRLIAASSHNRMLIAIGELLLDPANHALEELLDTISFEVGEAEDFAREHELIALAIQRRDPDAAEHAMRTHMDRLIGAVHSRT